MEVFALGAVLIWLFLVRCAYRSARDWVNNWGATADEQRMQLLGAEKLGSPRILNTHAVTVNAPPELVWPYLIQIGQGRGGFYSYTWIENLMGSQMHNVGRVVPELQELKVGDKVYLHPKAPPLTVTFLEPNRLLALEGWFFQLSPAGPGRTRLLARGYDWREPGRNAGAAELVLRGPFFDFAHFIMERRMLLRIKALAEEAARALRADGRVLSGRR